MKKNMEKNKEHWGDTTFGEGLGCSFVILSCAIALGVLLYFAPK